MYCPGRRWNPGTGMMTQLTPFGAPFETSDGVFYALATVRDRTRSAPTIQDLHTRTKRSSSNRSHCEIGCRYDNRPVDRKVPIVRLERRTPMSPDGARRRTEILTGQRQPSRHNRDNNSPKNALFHSAIGPSDPNTTEPNSGLNESETAIAAPEYRFRQCLPQPSPGRSPHTKRKALHYAYNALSGHQAICISERLKKAGKPPLRPEIS